MNSGMYRVLAFVAGQGPATLVPVVVRSGKVASHGSSGQRQRHHLQEVRQVQPPSRLQQGLRVFHVSAYVRYPGAWPAGAGPGNWESTATTQGARHGCGSTGTETLAKG